MFSQLFPRTPYTLKGCYNKEIPEEHTIDAIRDYLKNHGQLLTDATDACNILNISDVSDKKYLAIVHECGNVSIVSPYIAVLNNYSDDNFDLELPTKSDVYHLELKRIRDGDISFSYSVLRSEDAEKSGVLSLHKGHFKPSWSSPDGLGVYLLNDGFVKDELGFDSVRFP